RQEAEKRGITVGDKVVQARIVALRSKAGASAFNAALSRNGFTAESFSAYQRALLTAVALMRAMAGDRARSAAAELNSGATFASVDRYSPQGTAAWFTKFVDDRESTLRRAGKIAVKIGNHGGG